MSVLEIIFLILGIGIMNILCFLIGARTGQKVVKGEEVTLPSINPIQVVKSYEERREEERAEREYKENLEAINNYDGNI